MRRRSVGQDVGEWLDSLGLGRYRALFAEHDIDAEVLPELTEGDLERLGISIGHRKKLLRAIAEAKAGPRPAGGEGPEPGRRQLTVMFCDMVGSTALTAGIDPEQMHDIIERYFHAIADTAARFGGYIARYMGDGALVYFGWPRADELDAEHAVAAGLTLIEAVHAIPSHRRRLRARIGIATGPVVVGSASGPALDSEQLVVGHTLNLAARLQAAARPDSILIADTTRRLVGHLFDLERTRPLRLKGLSGPTTAWRVRGESTARSRFAGRRGAPVGLIDREAERALLLEAWRSAVRGRGRAVVLVGEAGIGKSRVAHALLDRLAAEPHWRELLQCSPLHANTAFHPAIRHLEQAAGLTLRDSPERRLAKLSARLRQLGLDPAATRLLADLLALPGAAEPPLDPRQRKARMLGALADHLLAPARQGPGIVLVEDAHWIDPSTLELLELLLARIERLPVLIVATARPDLVPFAGAGDRCMVHRLQRLEAADAGDLLHQLAGNKGLPPELAGQLLARADGVPLFIEELTQSLLESGQLVEHADEWKAGGRAPRVAIPATLQDSLMSRLDRLGSSKEIAQLGAAVGTELSLPLLARISGRDPQTLSAHLDRLVEAGHLFRDGDGDDAPYVFRHALIQDAAYESMLLGRRRQLHARIAGVLEQASNAQPELVARHYTEAGLFEDAVAWWQSAAEHSLRRSAALEAIEHCYRCLELLPNLPAGPPCDAQELEIRIQLGVALSGTYGYTTPEWEANTTRLVVLADRADSASPNLIPVLWQQWVRDFSVADMGGALKLAERILGFAERLGERTALMVGHRVLGASLLGEGWVARARIHLEQALAYHDAEKDAPLAYVYALDQRLSSMGYLSLALIACGYPDWGMRVSDEARVDALRLDLPTTTGLTLSLRLGAHMLRRDPAGMRGTAEELGELMRRHPHRGREVLAAAVLALLEAQQTGREAAFAGAGGAIEELQGLHWNFWVPWLLSFAAEIRLESGQPGAAARLIERAEALIEPARYMLCAPELARLRASLARAIGNGRDEQVVQLERAIALARTQGARLPELRAATDLAQVSLDNGEGDRARSLVEPIMTSLTEGSDLDAVRRARAILASLR
jgi:class 3 adenylate cyclase/type II secretory pathway predicted ATPase ExeA